MTGIAAFLGTCCVSPLAVTLFGVGGAVTLARLAWLQPWLLLAGVASIALAFRLAYRPARNPVDACDPTANRRTRRIVWVAAVVMVVIAIVSIAPLFYSFA
jgi:hypothetical protein